MPPLIIICMPIQTFPLQTVSTMVKSLTVIISCWFFTHFHQKHNFLRYFCQKVLFFTHFFIFWVNVDVLRYAVFKCYRFSDLINCLSNMLLTSQIDVGTDQFYRSWSYSAYFYSFQLFYKYTLPFLFLNASVTFPLILPVSNYPFFLEIFTYWYFITQKISTSIWQRMWMSPPDDLCVFGYAQDFHC